MSSTSSAFEVSTVILWVPSGYNRQDDILRFFEKELPGLNLDFETHDCSGPTVAKVMPSAMHGVLLEARAALRKFLAQPG
jgi:hypothetical protein